jgi:hypothetical protein
MLGFDDPDRNGEAIGLRPAIGGDVVVDAPGVGDAVGAFVAVPRDHCRLRHAGGVHDREPAFDLGWPRFCPGGTRGVVAEEGAHVTDVVVAIEDVEVDGHGRSA